MSLNERVKSYERQAAILEGVAKRYPEGSAEFAAVRQAAIALWYALSQPNDDFLTFLEKWNKGQLTQEQEAHLRSMGIDPDAIEES